MILVYSNHFFNAFHFDDAHVIQFNEYVKSLHNIPLFFKDAATYSTQPLNQQYRPMVSLSLAIDFWLGHGEIFWFHLSTFVWYAIQFFCLYYLFLKITNHCVKQYWNNYFAVTAALWYSIHPAQAETINYISARSDALSTSFLILALTTFIAFPKARRFGGYLIPFIIACLFKQTAIVFPALLWLYLFFFEDASYQLATKKSAVAGIIACGLAYFLIHMDSSSYESGALSATSYWMTQPSVLFHYLCNAILPIQLTADADWPLVTHPLELPFLMGCFFIMALFIIIAVSSQKIKTRPIAFGLLWFLIAHLPTACIPLADPMNDHRMFLPNIGLLFSIAYSLYLLTLKYLTHAKPEFILCLILALGGYAYGTYQRNIVWKTEESLWYDVTQKSPHNGRGLMAYGVIQLQKNHLDLAESYLLKAQKYSPTYSYIYMYLGALYEIRGDIVRAEKAFNQAMLYGKDRPIVLYHYANFYVKRNPPLAKKALLHAIQISPGDSNILRLLKNNIDDPAS